MQQKLSPSKVTYAQQNPSPNAYRGVKSKVKGNMKSQLNAKIRKSLVTSNQQYDQIITEITRSSPNRASNCTIGGKLFAPGEISHQLVSSSPVNADSPIQKKI